MKVNHWILKAVVALGAFLAGTSSASAEVQPEAVPLWGWLPDFPRDVSEDGWRIDWLIDVTMVFVVVLFVIMCVWMFWACFFHNEDHEADYDHGSSQHSVITALVISSVVFLIMDGTLLVNSIVDLDQAFWNFDLAENLEDENGREGKGDPRPECGAEGSPTDGTCAVRLEVNARQWAWQARYAGLDGEFNTPDDVEVLNDIVVPAGSPVIVQLAATDVIHAFYLPNLRAKMDAVPGMINRLWFRSKDDARGDFDLGCAQHCGTHHYKMKGKLTIVSQEDFSAWLGEASQTAARAFDINDVNNHWGWSWARGGNG